VCDIRTTRTCYQVTIGICLLTVKHWIEQKSWETKRCSYENWAQMECSSPVEIKYRMPLPFVLYV
jgi:hypothetical protein